MPKSFLIVAAALAIAGGVALLLTVGRDPPAPPPLMTTWFAGEWERSVGPRTMPAVIAIAPGRVMLDADATTVEIETEGPSLLVLRAPDSGRRIRITEGFTADGGRAATVAIDEASALYVRRRATP